MRNYRPLNTPNNMRTRSEIFFYWDYQNVRAANENYRGSTGNFKSLGEILERIVNRIRKRMDERK